MSVFDEYTLSPGAVASLTEPSPDLQRNYRQRGMMDNYGRAEESGRWKYSLRDLVGIWISDRLAQRGRAMDRREALIHGYSIAPAVIEAFLAYSAGIKPHGEAALRFTVTLNDGYDDGVRPQGSEVLRVQSLAEIEAKEFDSLQVIDNDRLARTIPEKIQGLLIAAAENEADS